MSEPDPGSDLLLVLEQSRDRGFLGPGPVQTHVAQAGAFRAVLGESFDGQAVDLGSGGGVPGLILAPWLPDAQWLLVDASLRRVRFLKRAIRELGLSGRAEALHARAEDIGRDGFWRGRVDAVVARGFGPPAVVAECASPLLRVGGVLTVSEPPRAEGARWPAAGVGLLGLMLVEIAEREGYRVAELVQESACPSAFPRRTGVPVRTPLF